MMGNLTHTENWNWKKGVVVELCLDTLEEEVDDLDEESISNQYMVNEWSLRKNYIFI